jgi:hypothetical protein
MLNAARARSLLQTGHGSWMAGAALKMFLRSNRGEPVFMLTINARTVHRVYSGKP